MRRSNALAVDTNNDLVYELAITPRSSIDSTVTDIKHDPTSLTLPPQAPTQHTITPSIRLLYSLISKKHLFCLLIPAVLSSIIAGGIAPFMTFVIGQAFDVFATFPHTPNPPQQAKDELLRGVGLAALELIGLAVGSLALGSITSSLWIWTGEVNVMALRKAVYDAVTHKDIVWFDSHMGATDAAVQSDGDGPIGAGGLMAKFTKETDDVRLAIARPRLRNPLALIHGDFRAGCYTYQFRAASNEAEEGFEREKQTVEKSCVSARLGRHASSREVLRARWDTH